jgi:type VI secretion system (T6SS) baseplate-like injector VgrG
MSSSLTSETRRTQFYGKYRGIVIDDQDPLQRGRIRADVPAVLHGVPSGWALPCVPYAGPGCGLHAIPPPGAGVWIEFEGGDPDYPVWTGGWWGDGQVPADHRGTQATPPVKILRSDQGLIVALDDDGPTITVSDADGSNLLTIEAGGGTVRIEAAAKVVVEAPQVELVADASHPVAFGDVLSQYLGQVVSAFNAHLHVGQTAAGGPVSPAPPVTPLPPPDPGMLSTKVKAG